MKRKYLIEAFEYIIEYIDKLQSDTRGTGSAKQRKWERETNKYQRELRALYIAFATRLALRLDEADPEEFDVIIEEELAVFESDMQEKGREKLLFGMMLGLGAMAVTPALLDRVTQRIRDNDTFISLSLIPAIRERARAAAFDPDVLLAGVKGFESALFPLGARTELYAGAMWNVIMEAVGDVSEREEDNRIIWMREALAKHCPDCLEFGEDSGKIYNSFAEMLALTGGAMPGSGVQCNGNCRCTLLVIREEEFVRP